MKKTIGHRGVETTTGETTYKKVRTERGGGGLIFDTHKVTAGGKSAKGVWCLYAKISLEIPVQK